jgi:hypothetical protein
MYGCSIITTLIDSSAIIYSAFLKIERTVVFLNDVKQMPTFLYPLSFNETLGETEIVSLECSNGIYVSSTRFTTLNYGAQDSEMVLLKITRGGQSILAHITSIHHGESAVIYAPLWICDHLGGIEGEEVTIERVHPALGTTIRIQPVTSEYASETDPVQALRNAFESYSCLTPGLTVPLHVGENRIYVTIMETNGDAAICIRGMEIEVQIDRPLDTPEPEHVPLHVPEEKQEDAMFVQPDTRFPGSGYRLGSR